MFTSLSVVKLFQKPIEQSIYPSMRKAFSSSVDIKINRYLDPLQMYDLAVSHQRLASISDQVEYPRGPRNSPDPAYVGHRAFQGE